MAESDKSQFIQPAGLDLLVKFPAMRSETLTDSRAAAERCTRTWAARGLRIVTVPCSRTSRRYLASRNWTARCNVTSVPLRQLHFQPQLAADWKRESLRTLAFAWCREIIS